MRIAAILFVMITLTSAKPLTLTSGELKEGVYYETGATHPYSGYCRLKLEAGMAEGTMSQGLMHGVWNYFYSNGNMKAVELYESGQRLRVMKSWYWGGELQNLFDETAEADTCYYRSGKVKSVTHYNGFFKNGDAVEWYENGAVRLEYVYYDHMEHGVCKEYYDNGQLALLSIYNSGKKSGVWLAYTTDGRLKYKGRYSEDCKVGKWYERTEEGKLARYNY